MKPSGTHKERVIGGLKFGTRGMANRKVTLN